MRLFGILLIVANLIAGGAFVYLATQDWKGRQSITARMLQHQLQLQGFPLEGKDLDPDPEGETPFVVELGGGEKTKTISKKLLEGYFQTVTAATPAPATGGAADPAAPAPTAVVSLTTGNPVVTNQLAEVKRVQGIINTELDKEGVATAVKLELLKGWLLLQAETYETRLAYQALLSPTDASGQPKAADKLAADAAELKKLLMARFDAVINPPDANRTLPNAEVPDLTAPDDEMKKRRKEMDVLLADEDRLEKQIAAMPADDKLREALKQKREALRLKREETQKAQKAVGAVSNQGRLSLAGVTAQRVNSTGDDSERRLRLAHLLVHLDPDPVWQKRVAVVVGLRRYVRAIADQVPRFAEMIKQVELIIPVDQAVFAKHEAQLRESATQNAERARVIAEQKAALADQKNKEDDAVNRQRTQLKELTDLLNRIKAEVDDLLVRQAGIEKQLYEIQREVGLTLEEVYRLEELLDNVERERFGLPPRPRR